MSSFPGSEFEDRLSEIADSVVAAPRWNPNLHPRAKNGRFIKVGGWVRGIFRINDQVSRKTGQVTGIRPNSKNAADPFIDVAVPDIGKITTTASRIELASEYKAFLDETPKKPLKTQATEVPWEQARVPFPWEQGGSGRGVGTGKGQYVWKPPPPPKPLPERIAAAKKQANKDAEKLDTKDPAERAKGLNKIMGGVRGSPLSTVVQFDKRGDSFDEWDLLRMAKHEQLWQQFLYRVALSGVKRERKALALGGLPGAGKTWSLRPGEVAGEFGVIGWDTLGEMPEGTTHITLNPDTIKEMMIDAGMLPEGISDKIKPREQVSFIHAESNFLTQLFLQRLSHLGYNIVYDTTMANVPHVTKNMAPLAENNYRFQGLYTDIPYEESRISATKRYIEEWESERGGRYVPSEAGAGGSNRGVFDAMRNWFEDGYIVVNNRGVSRGEAANEVVERGRGDGSSLVRYQPRPTDEFWRLVLRQEMERALEEDLPVAAAVGEMELWTTTQLAQAMRMEAITPEDALARLRANQVIVADAVADGDSWEDEAGEWSNKSTLHHELYGLGREDLSAEFAQEIARLRTLGQTMTTYIGSPMTAAVGRWNPDLHPRGRDGKFIEKLGLVDLFGLSGFQHGQRGSKKVQGKVIDIIPDPKKPKDPIIRVEMTDPRWDPKSFGPTVDVRSEQVAARTPQKGVIPKTAPAPAKKKKTPAPAKPVVVVTDTGAIPPRTPHPFMTPSPDGPGFAVMELPEDWLTMSAPERLAWVKKTMEADFTEWRGKPTTFNFEGFDSGVAFNLANTYRELANWDPDTARRIDHGISDNINDPEGSNGLGASAIAVAHPGTAHPGGIGPKIKDSAIVFGQKFAHMKFWAKQQEMASHQAVPFSMSSKYGDPTVTLVHEYAHQRQFRFLDVAMRDVGKAWSPVVREDGFGMIPDSSNWPITQSIRYDIPKATPTQYGQTKTSEGFAEAWSARLLGDASPQLVKLLDDWDAYMGLSLQLPEERYTESTSFDTLTPEERDAFWQQNGGWFDLPGMRDHYPESAKAYDEWLVAQEAVAA